MDTALHLKAATQASHRHSEGAWSSPGYRSGRTRAKWAEGLFVLTALASVWQLVLALEGVALAGRALDGDPPTQLELVSFIRNADGAQSFFVLCAVGLAIAFLAWLSRTVEITPALGAGTPSDSPRWAIAWWFIPIAFLWKPYTVVRESWDRLAVAPKTKGGTIVVAWWLGWIGASVLGRLANAMADSASSWAAVESGFWVSVGSSALSVAAAACGFLVVREIQARADTRAIELGFDLQPIALPSAAPQSSSSASAGTARPLDLASANVLAITAAGSDASSPDPGEALRNLNALRDQGLITEPEYAAKRAEIIGRL